MLIEKVFAWHILHVLNLIFSHFVLVTCEEFVRIYLRNKFHFSEVHESMNATGPVQSSGVTLTLHGTRCVHISMNLRKIKFISDIYTLIFTTFLFIICAIFI